MSSGWHIDATERYRADTSRIKRAELRVEAERLAGEGMSEIRIAARLDITRALVASLLKRRRSNSER